jgi:UPF0755 protein
VKKITLLFLGLLPTVLALFWYFLFVGPGGTKEPERFIVKPDTTQEQIIDDLAAMKYFKSKTIFKFFLSRTGKEIAPGAYLITGSMNVYRLAKVLTSLPYQKWVTIPPAKRKEQVALILERALDWPEDRTMEFIRIAQEGWLYADTYLINTDYGAEETYQKLYSTFNENLDSALQKTLLDKNIRLNTAIRFASLIEREYGSEEDRSIIAAILWNRLDKDMRLEIDATVQYALSTQRCRLDNPSLLHYDLLNNCDFWPKLAPGETKSIESDYSTYANKGLPIGPICSPSIASIWAVVQPADTKALYYLHSADKQIHTANTYPEHLKNIKKYLN